MRVNRLYILGITTDKEVLGVCTGLVQKYRARCEEIALVYPPGKAEKGKGTGVSPFQCEVGAYVVLHALGPGMTDVRDLSPGGLVKHLKEELGEDFCKLGKLVLLGCNLAYSKNLLLEGVVGESVDSIRGYDGGAGFLLRTMVELQDEGVTPKLVGWDSYISALPHVPGKLFTDPEKAEVELSRPVRKQKIGSKIGRGLSGKGAYGLAKGAYSQEHKRTFWIEDGKVIIDGNTGWSQIK